MSETEYEKEAEKTFKNLDDEIQELQKKKTTLYEAVVKYRRDKLRKLIRGSTLTVTGTGVRYSSLIWKATSDLDAEKVVKILQSLYSSSIYIAPGIAIFVSRDKVLVDASSLKGMIDFCKKNKITFVCDKPFPGLIREKKRLEALITLIEKGGTNEQ